MSDPTLFRLRVTYEKRGRLAYLSHLETARALERCIRRAQLPYAVSEGFSPHMKIAYGSALPVGIGSTCEIFDVFLTKCVHPETALQLLKDSSCLDLVMTDASYIDARRKAASVAFPKSTYEVVFNKEIKPLVVPRELVIVRKKNTKTLVVDTYLEQVDYPQENRLEIVLISTQQGSLRPDILLAEMLKLSCEEGIIDQSVRVEKITRIKQEA